MGGLSASPQGEGGSSPGTTPTVGLVVTPRYLTHSPEACATSRPHQRHWPAIRSGVGQAVIEPSDIGVAVIGIFPQS
jgi:hypothetical protein